LNCDCLDKARIVVPLTRHARGQASIPALYRADKMEHRLVSVSNSVTLFIGPASFSELELFCNAASEYRETTDEWLKRKQAEHNAFERTLQVSPIKPPTGPRLTCEVPPRQ